MENIKIRVTDNQRPAAIQNYLFASGYRWPISGTEIQVSGAKEGDGFYGTSDGIISWDQKRHFDESNFEEIFFAHKGEEIPKHSHYKKNVEHLKFIDVYRVLDLYEVTDPAIAHAVKKLLVAGGRGAGKDIAQDIDEAIDSLLRWKEMRDEEQA